MAKLGKTVAFCAAALLLFSGMFMVETSSAQTKPQTPQFTLSLQNNAVVLSIENQPFDVHNSDNYTFYYEVKIMTAGYYWASLPGYNEHYPSQSDSPNTIITYPIGKSSLFPSLTTVGGVLIPATGEVTFQVRALVGTLETSYSYPDGTSAYGLVGQVSGLNSQTINLPSNQSSPQSYVSPTGGMSTRYRLTMFSPNSQTTYDGALPLQFMLSWTYDLIPVFEPKTTYAYSIDDQPFVGIGANKTSMDCPGHGYTFVYNPAFSYMIDVSNLTDGHHEIKIRAIFDFGHTLLNDTSASFSFNVKNSNPHISQQNTSTPAPAAEDPSVSASADATPTPTAPEFPIIIVLAVMLSMASLFLVLNKKRIKT